MITVTMTCSTCNKDLSACEWTQHSRTGEDLQLWSTDGHIVRFDYDAMPVIADCPKSPERKAK